MTTATPGLGLPIPQATDDYRDGFDAIADLGLALDTHLTAAGKAASLVEYDSDWRIDSFYLTRVGGLVHLRGQATFTRGSSLVVPSDGNIGNETVANLFNLSDLRPPLGQFSLHSGHAGRTATFLIQPASTEGILATLHLVALGGSADLANNAVVTFSGFYIEEPPS